MDENEEQHNEPTDQEIHDQLLSEAEASDRDEETSGKPASAKEEAGAGEGEAEPTSPEAKAEADKAAAVAKAKADAAAKAKGQAGEGEQGERGPDGKFLPKKPESEFARQKREKAEKEKARLDRNWENQQRIAEENRQERARLIEADRQLRERAARGTQETAPRFSTEQLMKASKDFHEEGMRLLKSQDVEDIEKAYEKFELADKARASAEQSWEYEQREAYQGQMGEFNRLKAQDAAKLQKEHPEFAEEDNPVVAAMNAMMEEKTKVGDFLRNDPEGWSSAYQLYELRTQAAKASGLEEENKKKDIEIKSRNQK